MITRAQQWHYAFVTFAVASMLTATAGSTRVVVDRLLMVLHDELWRKVSVLRRRKRIRSLLMRSSGQTGGACRFVPRRWRQRRRRPGDNRGSHDGGTVTDGLAISIRPCVFLCLWCALLHQWICHGYSWPTASLWLDSGARLAIGDAGGPGDTLLFIGHVQVRYCI